jgi:hypothetical protein
MLWLMFTATGSRDGRSRGDWKKSIAQAYCDEDSGLWGVTLCRWLSGSRRFEGTWCLRRFEGSCSARRLDLGCLNLDDEGAMLVRNAENHVSSDTAWYPRRPEWSEEQRYVKSRWISLTRQWLWGFFARQQNGVKCVLDLIAPYGSLNAWRFELYNAHARRAVRLSGVIKSIVGFALQERIWSVNWIEICRIISVQPCGFNLNLTTVHKWFIFAYKKGKEKILNCNSDTYFKQTCVKLIIKLTEEALDRTLWRICFWRGYGPVVRQTAEWMNIKTECIAMEESP